MSKKHELWELQSMQAAPLSVKISLTKSRIREWIKQFGEDGVYVSFSGGKDSTVLLDIVRQDYPNVPAVFVDVPTQYPELREFVKTFDNVEIVKPKLTFMQVCEKYGFPMISKEVSECVQGARKYLTKIIEEMDAPTDRQTDRQHIPYAYRYDRLLGIGKYQTSGNSGSRCTKYQGIDRWGTTESIGGSEESRNLCVRVEQTKRYRQIQYAVQKCQIGGGGSARDFANLTGIRTNKSRIVDPRLWKGYRQLESTSGHGDISEGRQGGDGDYP